MHPGALRALEFDRIVEALSAASPSRRSGGRAWRTRSRSPTPRGRGRGAGRHDRNASGSSPTTGCSPLRAPADLRSHSSVAGSRGPRARAAAAASRSPRSSTRSTARAPRFAARRGALPDPATPLRDTAASFERRDRATSAARSTRPARSSTTRARSCGPSATGCASSGRGCAARSSRTCAARTRRSTCRSRSSPSATAATCWSCAPNIAARFPASCTAARQRREPVPRAAQHGRDQQRHRRARGAGSRGGPPDPARADRRVPRAAPATAAHRRGGDRARRAAGARAVLDRRRRRRAARSRPTAASSCAARAIRC